MTAFDKSDMRISGQYVFGFVGLDLMFHNQLFFHRPQPDYLIEYHRHFYIVAQQNQMEN